MKGWDLPFKGILCRTKKQIVFRSEESTFLIE
jgi:hypothetical protein